MLLLQDAKNSPWADASQFENWVETVAEFQVRHIIPISPLIIMLLMLLLVLLPLLQKYLAAEVTAYNATVKIKELGNATVLETATKVATANYERVAAELAEWHATETNMSSTANAGPGLNCACIVPYTPCCGWHWLTHAAACGRVRRRTPRNSQGNQGADKNTQEASRKQPRTVCAQPPRVKCWNRIKIFFS